MNFPHGSTVTVTRVTSTDNGLGDTTEATTTRIWGPCAVAPRFATEGTDPHAPRVVVGKVIYGPAITLDEDDRLTVDGEVWQVDGLPAVWRSPFTGWAPGIEVNVVRAP